MLTNAKVVTVLSGEAVLWIIARSAVALVPWYLAYPKVCYQKRTFYLALLGLLAYAGRIISIIHLQVLEAQNYRPSKFRGQNFCAYLQFLDTGGFEMSTFMYMAASFGASYVVPPWVLW